MDELLPTIDRYDAPRLEHLRRVLRAIRAKQGDDVWPAAQLEACAAAGVFRWFFPESDGGFAWSTEQLVRGYVHLSAGCLTTAFVLTQIMGASGRIASSPNQPLRDRWLTNLIEGERFATLGISQLTTSQRHLGYPALSVTSDGGDYVLEGRSPWVTGAAFSDLLVLGAETVDGQQMLCAVDTNHPNLQIESAPDLVGLTGSQTSEVRLDCVHIPKQNLIAGPMEDVMSGGGAHTGGLQTSALAVGLATEAVGYLQTAAGTRPGLRGFADQLGNELDLLRTDLLKAAADSSQELAEDGERLRLDTFRCRARANSLVLRATQAALVAAKGSGFLRGHPAGRWCQEALFFLVWSCPRPVIESNLRELVHSSHAPTSPDRNQLPIANATFGENE